MLFTTSDFNKVVSPVPHLRDFVWFGEYYDGNSICEFDLISKQPCDFKSIDRSKLIRFGLVGHGMPLFFEVPGGIFKLAGRMLEVIYKVGDKEYYLTGHSKMYNDIITFKRAESDADMLLRSDRGPKGGAIKTDIVSYHAGYKTVIEYPDDELKFNFEAIACLPTRGELYIELKLVSNKDLDGQLIIKRNGRMLEPFEAPLKKMVGGKINWVVI
jgi:hypothetical protein